MKILFISENFPPEGNAPANRGFEHAAVWQDLGHQVTVVTCAPNFPTGRVYPGYRNRLHSQEKISGIQVHRVWSFIRPNRGIFFRLLDFFSFVKSSAIAGLFIKTDLILTTSPQFFVNFTGYFLKLVKRKPWVMEIRDLWPESASALGIVRARPLIKLAEVFELFFYRQANLIVVVTEGIKTNIARRGISVDKIVVAPNGVDLGQFKQIAHRPSGEKTRIAYIGTLGAAHKIDFILNSLRHMESRARDTADKFTWKIVGDGAERQNLLELSATLSLRSVQLHEAVPHSEVPKLLADLDWGLVNLKKSETFKSAIPSKLFELAAAGIPILLGVDGEAKKLVEKYEAGIYFEPENEQSFLAAVKIAGETNESQWKKYSQGARNLAKDFDRPKIAKQLISHFESLV